MIGQAGVEADLRPLPARPRRLGAAHRRLARPADEPDRADGVPPQPGNTLRLTIDIDLQRAAEQALARRDRARARRRRGLGGRRRRDRRARPARRRGARARVEPDLRAVGLRQPRPAQARAAPERRRSPRRRTIPGLEPRDRRRLSAGLDVEAGDGARGDAGAHPHAVPSRSCARRASRSTSRRSTTGIRTSTSWMELPPALAESCDTYFYQVGARLLRPAAEPRPPAPELGVALRVRRDDRDRHRPRGRRARADARVAAAGTSAARRTREIDRIWKPGYSIQLAIGQGDLARDAAPDGALLRDDRERRPARHPAHRRGRRAADERPEGAAGAARASRRSRRPRPASTRPRSRSCSEGLYEATHSPIGTSYGVFGRSRSRSPARRARPRS